MSSGKPAVSTCCCSGGDCSSAKKVDNIPTPAQTSVSCCSGGGGSGCCGGQQSSSADAAEAKLDFASAPAVHASVQKYYSETLQSTGDLQYSACTATGPQHPLLTAALNKVPEEVMARFYGCGNPLPLGLDGLTVLDLGSGSGRDCYVCAQLVGEHGHVIGVDMTDAQLAVARNSVAPFTAAMGYKKPNLEFLKGYIEQLTAAGVSPHSVDVCISNCVVNLAPDKRAVLKSVYEVLREGGEFYFSDVYSDRRVPAAARANPVLVGECIGGALYKNDFEQLCREVGFTDPRMLSIRAMPLPDRLRSAVGDTRFFSITYRLFKLPALEHSCEDYHQTATYKGTITGYADAYQLDQHHTFPTNKTLAVCGNTAAMLADSWLAKHFTVTGDCSVHYGSWAHDLDAVPASTGANAAVGGGCCGGSCGPRGCS